MKDAPQTPLELLTAGLKPGLLARCGFGRLSAGLSVRIVNFVVRMCAFLWNAPASGRRAGFLIARHVRYQKTITVAMRCEAPIAYGKYSRGGWGETHCVGSQHSHAWPGGHRKAMRHKDLIQRQILIREMAGTPVPKMSPRKKFSIYSHSKFGPVGLHKIVTENHRGYSVFALKTSLDTLIYPWISSG